MRSSWRDAIASVLVAIGVVIYLAWVFGSGLPGFIEPAAVATAMLVLGVLASASAVVPGFAELLRGSRLYFASASALGLVALGAGICTIAGADPNVGLFALAVTTVLLWAMSTLRHVSAGQPRQRIGGPVASAR